MRRAGVHLLGIFGNCLGLGKRLHLKVARKPYSNRLFAQAAAQSKERIGNDRPYFPARARANDRLW
jgi:hypothetical protein